MPESLRGSAGKIYCFGPFRLDSERRELLQDGQPVHLRAREFDILVYLVERAGEFVTKDELTDKVWAVTYVSDANVRVQIAALRRVLGDGRDSARYIVSAAGRGYSFCAPLLADAAMPASGRLPRSAVNPDLRYNLPIRLKPTLGRGEASHRLISHLPYQRLVTIVGAGGIGKTTLALTAAEGLIDAYDDGVRFVDLASLSDPALIASSMAAPLGLTVLSSDPEEDLIGFLEDKQILFIVDNCEHLIEAVAALVERILTQTRDVHFLTTSREPLRADGEWLFRLGPLDVPPRAASLTANEAIAYPAVKLFVERARLGDSLFQFLDSDALTVAELCRRLDGNPLAVELAAARVGLFGVQGLASQLDESFNTLTQGRRTALPRHQTLRATLDWSYEILSPAERALLFRLSIFRSEFTLVAARAVASASAGDIDIFEGLAGLTAKSLINVDVTYHPARYRMLFLTRDYAHEKLIRSGELDLIARRHALYYLELLRSSEGEEKDPTIAGWIDDIRTAIDWAFSPSGDVLLATKLVSASLALSRRLSLLPEYGRRVTQALNRMPEVVPPEPLLQIRLLIEQAYILLHTVGNYNEIKECSATATRLAEEVYQNTGDIVPLYEALQIEFGMAFGAGDSPNLLTIAQKAHELNPFGADHLETTLMTYRMLAQAWHFVGNHEEALKVGQQIIATSEKSVRARNYLAGDRQNPLITVRIFQARCHWIMGRPERATEVAKEAAKLAEPQGVQLCYALGMAVVPITLWRGNYIEAKAAIVRLADVAEECGLGYWANWARTYQAVISICENDNADMDDPADLFRDINQDTVQRDHLATFHENLASSDSFIRVESGQVGWNAPEVLRATTQQRLIAGSATPAEAEALLLRSLGMAREQRALSWQVRTATSLGRLWGYQGREEEAQVLLTDTLNLVSEGYGDSDYIAAEALLNDLKQRTVEA